MDPDFATMFNYKNWRSNKTTTVDTYFRSSCVWTRYDYYFSKYIDELFTDLRKCRSRTNPRKVNIAANIDISEII